MLILKKSINKLLCYLGTKSYSLIEIYCLIWIVLMLAFLVLSSVAMIGHTAYCSVVGTELFCHAQHSVVL